MGAPHIKLCAMQLFLPRCIYRVCAIVIGSYCILWNEKRMAFGLDYDLHRRRDGNPIGRRRTPCAIRDSFAESDQSRLFDGGGHLIGTTPDPSPGSMRDGCLDSFS